MQFKHPEILYALFLLIIPILVHLFQLRKFEKVAFTNVQFLRNITLQTRKSSQLKKWLTLLTRLLLLTCIIIAFAQPYQAQLKNFKTAIETVIYLDNSFSMQAKGKNGSLLNTALQDLITNADGSQPISLFTNDRDFPNTTINAIKNDLIQLDYSAHQMDYNAVVLKGQQFFNKDKGSIKNFIFISDFQEKKEAITLEKDSLIKYKLVRLQPEKADNVSVDSLYILKANPETIELSVHLSNTGIAVDNVPVTLYDSDNLIAKSAVAIDGKAEVVFTVPNNALFKGKIEIEDANLIYDNTLYFNLDANPKIKILVINASESEFLQKLYGDDEFDLDISELKDLNYNSIQTQNLIVLNELQQIPISLITSLSEFHKNGGHVLTIPSPNADLESYNQLFTNYNLPTFRASNPSEKRITTINFSHPLIKDVFEETVANFQYPKVTAHFSLSDSRNGILGFEDKSSFLIQSGNTYAFSASISEANSNFKNSPLIVPIFYNIAKHSLKLPRLYYSIGSINKIDISAQLKQDEVLTVSNSETAFVPLQQSYKNKVQLTVEENPKAAGIYDVKDNDSVIEHLSFNYDRVESNLSYMELEHFDKTMVKKSVAQAFEAIKSETNVNELWKWFVIFAVAFLIIEMLILKLLK